MKAKVIIERADNGSYSAYIGSDNVPFGIIGVGKSAREAINDFKEALVEMRESYAEDKQEFPEVEFEYVYDLPSFLQYYAYAFSLAGLERITGVNQKQLGNYISGFRRPSEKTIRKIEEKIHTFAEELEAVRFG